MNPASEAGAANPEDEEDAPVQDGFVASIMLPAVVFGAELAIEAAISAPSTCLAPAAPPPDAHGPCCIASHIASTPSSRTSSTPVRARSHAVHSENLLGEKCWKPPPEWVARVHSKASWAQGTAITETHFVTGTFACLERQKQTDLKHPIPFNFPLMSLTVKTNGSPRY